MAFYDAGHFIIENYPSQKPFSSFLPGIAGTFGIPMWVFYTNRGQAIAGFGVESKDSPIMEFQPANKAYQLTPFTGFRTFIKIMDEYYEPFSTLTLPHNPHRDMFIGMNELEIQDFDSKLGIQTNITYFTLTNEPFAGLVRQVTLKNTTDKSISLQLLDGMAAVIPYGLNDFFMKMMARTSEAWLEVFNMENDVPFFRTRASIVDKSEVEGVEAGHFCLTFHEQGGQTQILRPIVDPSIIFGSNTSLSYADQFMAHNLAELLESKQVTIGKMPCSFSGTEVTLNANESFTLHSIIGHVNTIEILNRETPRIATAAYLKEQHEASKSLVQSLTDTVAIKTSSPVFDAYARQTFLDNAMRGGWPLVLNDDIVYHVYSRKHGDMERDYNAFFLAAEPFSQGNGNFRDVNQNRREDVWLNPAVKDFNIRTFVNLIQADGYNPLVLHGSKFTIPEQPLEMILDRVEEKQKLREFLSNAFTPGELLTFVDANQIELKVPQDEFLQVVFQHAQQSIETSFDEGYWVDHWTYNLDLIENYLAIYPDKEAELLFEDYVFTFYDSAAVVRPRHEKYVLSNGSPRQFNSVKQDAEKAALIASRDERANVVRTQNGHGDIYYTTLVVKLLSVAIIKMATLDPYGMGVEMEADKPGWYDAINGLPGLFGSSMPETFELLRLVRFIRAAISKHNDVTVSLPVELAELLDIVAGNANYWQVTESRENYREHIRLGFSGEEEQFTRSILLEVLNRFEAKLEAGIERAVELNDGIPPTYFRYHPTDIVALDTIDGQGRPNIRVYGFDVEVLPLFLEGPVRALKITDNRDQARNLYRRVRESELFDTKLKMYRLNASLDEQPMDIGRARAFTAGWLENGSIWMHMAYKYLLSLLKAGLYDEFYEEFKNGLIAFQDPHAYGRSILENSSFIASSAHPDESIHGQGFVARLSGSTAEFLSILHHMTIGKRPFFMRDGRLHLEFKPILPAWLFDDEGTVCFTFLGDCKVIYYNLQMFSTHDREPRIIMLETNEGPIEIHDNVIDEPYSKQVRSGEITKIEIHF